MNMDFGEDWEGFWRTSRDLAAYRSGGPQQEVLDTFWSGFLQGMLPRFSRPRLLDLACGNGVVARSALEVASQLNLAGLEVVGLDQSTAGLNDLRRRSPLVHAITANAAELPIKPGRFDLVVSQFGVEYAGENAFSEVARVLAKGGVFAAVLHLRDGAIFKECKTNLAAVQAVEASGFLSTARTLFEQCQRPTAEPQVQRTAQLESEFQDSCSRMRGLIQSNEDGVAGGVVQRLFTDVTHMAGNRVRFDSGPVLAWINGMSVELRTYCGRMQSMMNASLAKTDIENIVRNLASKSVNVRVQEVMHMGLDDQAAAWVLVCEKEQS